MTGTWNTAEDGEDERSPRGVITYVACYDDLSADGATTLTALGPERGEIRVSRGERESRAVLRAGTLLLSDPYVSAEHALFWRCGVVDRIRNLSRRGTFVNGREVDEAELQDGDLVEIGHTLLAYRRVDHATADTLLAAGGARFLLGPTRTLAPAAAALARDLTRLAVTGRSILLHGERGSGKEVLARQIHAASGRVGQLVAFNAAAVTESLFESELFGHEPHSFNEARRRKGRLREAEGGTVLLDEVGALSWDGQQKLLRVIQENEVLAVGADRPVRIDVRWLAATNQDVFDAKQFRPDLLDRLSGHVLRVPPLRARREDIGTLCAHALATLGISGVRISRAGARRLCNHELPGNIRQLENAIKEAAILAGDRRIEPDDLRGLGGSVEAASTRGPSSFPPASRVESGPESAPVGGLSAGKGRQRFPGRDEIIAALERAGGVKAKAARLMGAHERTFARWCQRIGLTDKD